MATATKMEPEGGGARPWPSGLLHLAVRLSLDEGSTREAVMKLFGADPALEESTVRQQLLLLVVELVRAAAGAFAGAVGCTAEAVLRLALPLEAAVLEGERAVMHRLERRWGGPMLYSLEARREVKLCWPAPTEGNVLVLQGAVEVKERPLGDHCCAPLRPGMGMRMEPGGLVLLWRPVVVALLALAQDAGIEPQEIAAAVAGTVRQAMTKAGTVTLELASRTARINGRNTCLSEQETTALAQLLRQPGVICGREALNTACGLKGDRATDRVMLGLRNKLGDGVIATVYGAGYVLEAVP